MTIASYAQAKTVRTEAQILADLLTRLGNAGVQTAGLGDYSAELGGIRQLARALASEESVRGSLARAISLAEAALAGRSYLDAVALGRYDETPIPAFKALWNVSVTNLTASSIPVAAFELQAEGGGQLFQNTTGFTVPASTTVTLKPFEALVAGIGGNVAIGAIDELRKGKAGLAITNTSLVTAGRDVESSPAFVSRCLAKWGTLGYGGNIDAYNYLIPTGVPTITRWKVRDDNPGGPGTIWFYLANAAGPATPEEVAALAAYLTPKKPLGSGEFSYFAATEHPLAIGSQLITDGTNPSAATQAAAALIRLASTFALGPTTLQEELVKGILMGGAYTAFGLEGFGGVTNLSGLTFTVDEAIASGEVITITPTITQV